MTVTELIESLLDAAPEAIVVIARGPGPLDAVTITVNGYVILDAGTKTGTV